MNTRYSVVLYARRTVGSDDWKVGEDERGADGAAVCAAVPEPSSLFCGNVSLLSGMMSARHIAPLASVMGAGSESSCLCVC